MENKAFKHFSRHRIGYLVASLLIVVGAFSLTQSVPNFHALNNDGLTGSVGQLTENAPQLMLLEDGIQHSIVQSGNEFEVKWQTPNSTSSLYLVPENTRQRAVVIQQNVASSGGQNSYVWQVPDDLASGEYRIGISSGGVLDRSDAPFILLQNGDDSSSLVHLNTFLSQSKDSLDSHQSQLLQMQSKIEAKQVILNELSDVSEATGRELSTLLSQFESQKGSLSVESYKAMTQDIHGLAMQLTRQELAVEIAEAELASFELEAKTIELAISNDEVSIKALEQKQTELQGVTDVQLESMLQGQADGITTKMNGVTSGQVSLKELDSDIQVKQNQMTTLIAQMESLSGQIAEAEMNVSDAQMLYYKVLSDSELLSEALLLAQDDVLNIQNELSVTNDRAMLIELEKELNAAKNDVSERELALQTAQANTSSAMDRLSSGKRIVTAYQAQWAELESELKMIESELSILTAQSKGMQAELEITTLEAEALNVQLKQLDVISDSSSASQASQVTDLKLQ